jgi:hypothetical protein
MNYIDKMSYFQDMKYIEMKLENMQKLIDNITKTQVEILSMITDNKKEINN